MQPPNEKQLALTDGSAEEPPKKRRHGGKDQTGKGKGGKAGKDQTKTETRECWYYKSAAGCTLGDKCKFKHE